jgi:hypothetical protein
MYDYLVDHAIKNVWCTPNQDNQRIYAPKRLTPNGGVRNSFRVLWRLLAMPDLVSQWHVYQVGQVHPVILNLLPDEGKWTSFTEAINTRKLICDIYTDQGVQIPRFNSFFQFTEDHNLIIAIRKNVKLPIDFNNDQPFIRLYSNAYFASERADVTDELIYSEGSIVTNTEQILDLQNAYTRYSLLTEGAAYAFVNGYKVSGINLFTASVGDTCEFVYDSSIYKVVDFKVGDLGVFNSTLDTTLKYFLHYPGVDNQTIDYRDDIDFFLVYPGEPNSKGLWYHKNQDASVRMITHRDYSLPTAFIAGYQTQLAAMIGTGNEYIPQNLIVRLHIRKSGYDRALVFDANKIKELYKLPPNLIPRAMLGIDATLPNWQVDTLESSGYTEIMSADCCDITNALVNKAYGYNALSKLLGSTPQFTRYESNRKLVDLPYGLQSKSTVYEYDSEGILTHWDTHLTGSRYDCVNLTTNMIEVFSGTGGNELSDRFTLDSINVDATQSYRVYYNPLSTVGIPGDWTDITGTDKYIVTNGLLTRSNDIILGTLMVRTEAKFLAYDLELNMVRGELRFGLQQFRMVGTVNTSVSMEVPCGQLDLFLNGRSLIRNLDYFIKFPEIVIINKEYLNDPLNTKQKIHVRMSGYCEETLSVNTPSDMGFIEHGLLSNNDKFDLRDDKVLRIVVDGKLYDKSEMIFSEEHSGVSIQNPINGKPYSVQDIVVPLRDYVAEPTFTVRNRAVLVDNAVKQYLTLKIPQPVRNPISSIERRYTVFSPFICKIIYDLESGLLDDSRYKTNYNDMTARAVCQPYEYLLEYDPTQQDQAVNDRYVVVHPHNLTTTIDLDLFSYRFVERVLKIYTNNLVKLSGYVTLSST